MFPRIDQRMSQPGEVNLKEKQGYVQLHRNHLPVVQCWVEVVSVSKSCLSLPLCGQSLNPSILPWQADSSPLSYLLAR